MRQQQDEVIASAEFYMDSLANKVVEWAMEQALLREAALRVHGVSGGGIAPKVIFHDPEAVR